MDDMLVDDARSFTSQEDASPSPRDSPMQMFSDQCNPSGSNTKRKPDIDDEYSEPAKKPLGAQNDSPQHAGTMERVIGSQRSDSHETYSSTSAVKKTFHGIVCQWKHLMLILNRARKMDYSFRLATEMDAAGKFDDVVLEYEDSERGKVHRFMQIKHKQDDSQMITAGDLLDATDGEFSILKYFISWRAIKKNPTFDGSKSKEFILCSNVGLDVKDLNAKNIKVENLATDDLLKVTEETKSPPRFYKLLRNWSVLRETLKFASDVHRLAREIAERVCRSKDIHLNTEMIRDYHAALALEVIDMTKRKFSHKFIENNNLSKEGKKFREAFILHAKEFCPIPNAREDDVWKFLEKSELKLSGNFRNPFKLSEPKLEDVERFSTEFARLVDKASKDDVVKIDKRIYRKNAKTQSVERVVADNIDKLAGHVLITENGKIKFRQGFLNDDTPLPGNMEKIKGALKNRLKSTFTELRRVEFKINDYKTCTEGEFYSETKLPDDNINDGEISDFLNEFIFAVNQPNEQKLGEMINREIGDDSKFDLPNLDIIGESFQNNIVDWLKKSGNHSRFLKNKDADDFLSTIEQKLSPLITVGLNLLYLEELNEYGIRFELENTEIHEFLDDSNPTPRQQILKLPSPGQTLLTALRVYQTVKEDKRYQKDGSFFFIQLAKLRLSGIMKYVLSDFKSLHSHHLLVIDCATNDIIRDEPGLWEGFHEIMKANHCKRMILITGGNKDLAVRSETVINIGDLTKYSRQKLLERRIIRFQGHDKLTSFEELVGIPDCGNIESGELSSLSRIIDQKTLTQLIRSEEIPIGDGVRGLCEVGKYYIARTIVGHVVIEGAIFQDEKSSDLLAISGIDQEALKKLLEFEKRTNLKPRNYYMLEEGREEGDFKLICDQHLNRNIHWLQAESGKLLWKRSHGNIADLITFEEAVVYDENAERPGVTNFTEDQLMHHAGKCRSVIISDTAGMGKSTVLTHFAEKIKQNQPSPLVIKVDLNRHTCVLDKQKQEQTFDNTDTDKAVDFLVDNLVCLDTELEREVFKEIIKVTGGAALLFDGYDEISPEYESIVIDLLQALSSPCINRLFVTTRPHTSKELEKKLGTFSYHLQPFSRSNQTEFLIAFWKNGLSGDHNGTVGGDLDKHASEVLKILVESIDCRMGDFTGIPLLTRMVAEIFPYEEEGGQIDLDGSKKAYTIIDLYRLFVKKKYKVFCKEKQLGNDTNLAQEMFSESKLKIITIIHKKLALEALFPHAVRVLLSCQPIVDEMSSLLPKIIKSVERIGIVTQVINKNPHFVHRTFAEYFAAQFLIDTLIDNRRNEVVREFFVAEIFVRPQYKTIRAFLNCLLSDKDYASDDEKESWKFSLSHYLSYYRSETLYHAAVDENNSEIIRFFSHRLSKQDSLQQRANIDLNSVLLLRQHPLHMAITSNNLAIVMVLVEAGADINLLNRHSTIMVRPLHHALTTKDLNLNIVRYLVKAGADVNSAGQFGCTPLQYALQTKDLEIVRDIVEAGADINSANNNYGTTLLFHAIKTKDLEIVRYIVEAGADIKPLNNNDVTTLLVYAIITKDLEIVRYIVEAAADNNFVTKFGEGLLHEAIGIKDLKIVRYFVEAGAGINFENGEGLTPLHCALKTKDLEIIGYLVEEHADINYTCKDGFTPLHYALETGNSDTVKYIVEKGADINSACKDGFTPLHYAVKTKDLDIVKYIVEKDASINSKNKTGLTPLHYAVATKDLEIVRCIVEAAARDNDGTSDIEGSDTVEMNPSLDNRPMAISKDFQKSTPPHGAVEVKSLNAKWAVINSKNIYGITPLHHAVILRYSEIVQYLLVEGANVNSKADFGLTPWHFAVHGRDPSIVKCLGKHSASFDREADCLLTREQSSELVNLTNHLIGQPDANDQQYSDGHLSFLFERKIFSSPRTLDGDEYSSDCSTYD